uniref:DUF3667 domain-containing protein n=1 Tax=Roseihalotalea indica TaxID=2867963 RepID=A0AA49Q005_9BACT|nr:DUF3667 domain-containing protein [Tunicatimonas sp. TK19036]
MKSSPDTTSPNFIKKEPPRITIGHLWEEVLGTLSWDKGFFFTVKMLLLNPGKAIRDYLQGERKRYSHPIRFLVFTTAISTYAVIKLDLINKFYDEAGVLSIDEAGRQVQQQLVTFLYQYYNIITFLSIPLLAAFTYLFFLKKGYNYAEHLVLNAFLVAEGMLLYLVGSLGMYYFPTVFNTMYQFFWAVYISWGLISFFQLKTGKGIIKAVLVCLLNLLLMLVIGGVSGFLFMMSHNPA